jgi:Tfp pilus assembly protein PilF
MKICPFISHMIGDDGTNILEVTPAKETDADAAPPSKSTGSVVVLGYDGDNSTAVAVKAPNEKGTKQKTKAKTSRAKASEEKTSPLFCLKETCRFYQKKGSACMFDAIFDNVEAQAKRPAEPERKSDDKTSATVTKELDKFWKFQTKSVSELIASIGETEKKQERSFSDIAKKIAGVVEKASKPSDDGALGNIREDLAKLHAVVESREEGIDNFSTTVSELVMNLDDSMRSLREQAEKLSSRIGKLESSVSEVDKVHERVEKVVARALEGDRGKSAGIDALTTPLQSIVEAHRRLEDQMRRWRETMDARVQDMQRDDERWLKRIERIEERQGEAIELIESAQRRHGDEAARSRRKEAKKFNNLGVTSFHNGDLERARDQFVEAVARDAEFAEAFNNLGLVYTELSEEDKASEAFRRAIDLNPDLHAAYNNLGYVFYRQGKYEQAIEMYNEALGRSASSSSAYTNLGNAYFKIGNREEARQAWEKALELDPGNDRAIRNLKRLERE